MTHVHIVYAHPSERSFTREVLDAYLGGLDAAGHTRTVSDLNEIQRPVTTLVVRPALDAAHRQHWSIWHRRHQAHARASRYHRQAALQP
ncbi:hypothetical protein [Streptomyces sp. DG1A-41]|uniref:hypothetical protein n=1 Tax=Streptomyces sp. DG1A-41 TaxID=3125779 RepID=UPI0030CF16DD